jgi:hypothetical protein
MWSFLSSWGFDAGMPAYRRILIPSSVLRLH